MIFISLIRHNLFLGCTKHIVELLKEKGLITAAHMREMEATLTEIAGTRKYGRMRTKVEGNMSNFTAAEWKLFVVAYSHVLFEKILPPQYYSM